MMMKRPYCNLVVNGMRMLFMIPFVCAVLVMQAQTVIDIRGSVYGGARQADVGGHTFVNIGADHHDVIIGSVYGGNDISGNIGTSTAEPSPVPSELDEAETNKITANYNAFVRISPEPTTTTGEGEWNDLSGLLLPASEEKRLLEDIKNGTIESIQEVLDRFNDINDHYREYQWVWTYKLILDYYGIDELTDSAMQRIREDYVRARRAWIAEIRKDAQKEFDMGDVEQEVFDDFLQKLDHEIDYEN